jgi:hypothetical protein
MLYNNFQGVYDCIGLSLEILDSGSQVGNLGGKVHELMLALSIFLLQSFLLSDACLQPNGDFLETRVCLSL